MKEAVLRFVTVLVARSGQLSRCWLSPPALPLVICSWLGGAGPPLGRCLALPCLFSMIAFLSILETPLLTDSSVPFLSLARSFHGLCEIGFRGVRA